MGTRITMTKKKLHKIMRWFSLAGDMSCKKMDPWNYFTVSNRRFCLTCPSCGSLSNERSQYSWILWRKCTRPAFWNVMSCSLCGATLLETFNARDSFSRRNLGKPMPTLLIWGPSGLPYFSQFLLEISSFCGLSKFAHFLWWKKHEKTVTRPLLAILLVRDWSQHRKRMFL